MIYRGVQQLYKIYVIAASVRYESCGHYFVIAVKLHTETIPFETDAIYVCDALSPSIHTLGQAKVTSQHFHYIV